MLPMVDTSLPQAIDIPAIARRYAVEYIECDARPRLLEASPQRIQIFGRLADRRAIAQCLRRWLFDLAAVELDAQLRTIAEQFGFQFAKTQIRRQRTRWGSCSARGTISLNVCLLFLEPAILRYLMIHELCHTRQMNHSPRFWSLVEACEPDYRRLARA